VSSGVTPAPPTLEALAALLGKYETLAALRRARARGEPVPPKEVFRALAEAFPGALHELDVLPLEIIDARAEALRAACAGGPLPPWIPWMLGYHALMRAALRVKIRLARRKELSDERARSLAEDASTHAGIDVDEAFVRAVASPPEGRIASVVYARLAARFGVETLALRRALFPRIGHAPKEDGA
jgi:hypothetical protein